MVTVTGALSAAERSLPTSEVGGRSREDPMPVGQQPRGVTPCPRSGAAAESTRLRWHRNGREELPRIQGRGGAAERRYPASKVRGGNERSYPTSEVRGGSREEVPHVPSPRPGAAGGRSYPTSKEPWLRGHRRA